MQRLRVQLLSQVSVAVHAVDADVLARAKTLDVHVVAAHVCVSLPLSIVFLRVTTQDVSQGNDPQDTKALGKFQLTASLKAVLRCHTRGHNVEDVLAWPPASERKTRVLRVPRGGFMFLFLMVEKARTKAMALHHWFSNWRTGCAKCSKPENPLRCGLFLPYRADHQDREEYE